MARLTGRPALAWSSEAHSLQQIRDKLNAAREGRICRTNRARAALTAGPMAQEANTPMHLEPISIPLRNAAGHVVAHTTISPVDAALAEHRWFRSPSGYAMRTLLADGHKRTVALHRTVLGLPKGDCREVDHINRDKLDNRRENLRLVDRGENAQNVPARGGSSRHRGVSWHKRRNKWIAQARLQGHIHYLGYFDDEDEAGAAAANFRAAYMPFSEDASDGPPRS